jgi:membrane-associated phospholipid phosphatase
MDPEISRAARFLADHALLLLALGIGALATALAAVLFAVRSARRHQDLLIDVSSWLFEQARQLPLLGRLIDRGRVAIPTGYVALHLFLGLVATAATIAFIVIAEEVMAGKTVAAFDAALANALQESTSPEWRALFRRITRFGSGDVLTALSVVVAIALFIARRHVLAIGWIIAQAGGAFLTVTLKGAFERSRPLLTDPTLADGWSFPSGHALNTFVFCGLAAYLLFRLTRSWLPTAIAVVAAFSWCVIIGFTRLYLGVHYASDVGAGLLAALAWLAVCISGIEVGIRRSVRTA